MIVHRLQTNPNEPSVKFYRTIAISFLALTVILLGVVIFITFKKAVITVLAKEDIKNVSFNVDLISNQGVLGNQSIVGGVTSTVFFWEQQYSPTGNKVVDAVATGEAVIYNKLNVEQTLIKTTRLLSATGILFRLSDRVTVPANGQITAAIYSDKPGEIGEIGPTQFSIPGLSLDKQKFIYAETIASTTGGLVKSGVLTNDDLKSAVANYTEKAKQGYLSAYSSVFGGQNVVATLIGDPQSNHQSGEEVSEFKLSGTSTVVAVWYKPTDLENLLQKNVEANINRSLEKILSVLGSPQVAVSAYSVKNGTAQLAVTQNVMVTLDSNADKLVASNFLGKSKDEIQRYILGLDHVAGVEVKFSPAWMMSAPSVPDKIQVVVKNVK